MLKIQHFSKYGKFQWCGLKALSLWKFSLPDRVCERKTDFHQQSCVMQRYLKINRNTCKIYASS